MTNDNMSRCKDCGDIRYQHHPHGARPDHQFVPLDCAANKAAKGEA